MKTLCQILLLVFLGILPPGSPANGDEESKQTRIAVAKEILRNRCSACHGGTSIQSGLEILNHKQLIQQAGLVVPGKPDASDLFVRVTSSDESARMPPLGEPRLSNEEIESLKAWILEGAGEFPPDVPSASPSDAASEHGDEHVLQQILLHVRASPSDERPFLRYFSSHHLLTAGATSHEIAVHADALAKAINHLSREKDIVIPVPVNPPLNTIFAIDLRKIGWSVSPFNETPEARMNRHDLVLLEYPYAVLNTDSETVRSLAREYLQSAGLVRSIPVLRIDWFVSTALSSPLYEDLLGLPFELSTFEKELGVDVARNIKDGTAVRGGVSVSGVSRTIRAMERHSTSLGAYWKSIDFASATGPKNFFREPVDFHGDGGEMIASLPNGLQFYFVTDRLGRRVTEAPTSIVADRFASDAIVRNGLSCIRCHDQGIKMFVDVVRPAVEALPPNATIPRRPTLQLYPEQAVIQELLDADRNRFQDAMTRITPHSDDEPVTPVSRRFLDSPLHLNAAAAELGLPSAAGLTQIFRTSPFVSLGMAPLVSGGVVRRDLWESEYPRIVEQMGIARSILPIDGLTQKTVVSKGSGPGVELVTNHANNIFAPGDELVILIRNKTSQPVFVEVTGTDPRGRIAPLTDNGTQIPASGELRIPATGAIRVQPSLGREQITLYSSDQPFSPGQRLRGTNVMDRWIHPVFGTTSISESGEIDLSGQGICKQSIEIETK